jgi:hypothetical protein
MHAWELFWLAVASCIVSAALLEVARLQPRYPLPWWVVHGPLIVWFAVAIIPWFIALRHGSWPVAGDQSATVPLTLPATYEYTILALFGLAVGVVPATLAGRRPRPLNQPEIHGYGPISKGKASFVIFFLCIIYVISSNFSLSKIWVISNHPGQDLYSTNRGTSFLGLSIVILAGIALAYLARTQQLTRTGIILYLALIAVVLGSAHRYLVTVLLLAYLILKRPFSSARVTYRQRVVFIITLLGAVWLIGFSGLGRISAVRSGISVSASDVYSSDTASSFDVMSSAEYLFESGIKPDQLHGASYLDLPSELIPRVIVSSSRGLPPSTELQAAIFGPIGASAPLWIEGVLNIGRWGASISMVVISYFWGMAFRYASSSRRRIAETATAIGPVWILFLYQALSRILALAAIDLFGSMIIALALWAWMQKAPTRPDLVDLPFLAQPEHTVSSKHVSFQSGTSGEFGS